MDKLKAQNEFRVYAIDIDDMPEELDNKPLNEITKEEFMEEAERQGFVYTLSGFETAFNENDEINQNRMFIRIYEVKNYN